jgi:hypothetical protein
VTKFKARPTVYNGIKMRSRTEAGYAQWLDARGFDWEYEPGAFATPEGQYLPDFKLHNVPVVWCGLAPKTVYVEVKHAGYPEPAEQEDFELLLARMPIIWGSDPGAVLLLEQPYVEASEYPDTLNRVWLETGVIEPDELMGHWTFSALWVRTDAGGENPQALALAKGVSRRAAGPWPDGYWKGPR